jgi:arylsulfatase A-like enzyme
MARRSPAALAEIKRLAVSVAGTANQVREVNALNAVEVELIDEAIGRVMKAIEARGWGEDVDVIFTTDHGEFQGDFGFLFKGPYHVDALMRLPLIWRPARSTRPEASVVSAPVSLVSLAATFLEVAGQPAPAWVEGASLPINDDDAHARSFGSTVTEWDSALFGVDVHVRTVVTRDHLCSEYGPGTLHDGSEGELYDLRDDPQQRVNRFDDPAYAGVRATLHERLMEHEDRPGERAQFGAVMAPV